jgi:hypothetical protein
MTKIEIINEIQKQLQYDHYTTPEIKGVLIHNALESGGEGEGETYTYVYKITCKDGETFFVQANGHYDSYDGTDFSYCVPYEVEEYMAPTFRRKA